MSIITTGNIQAALNWTQREDVPLSHVADIGGVSTDNVLINGTGTEQTNMLWHDVIEVAASSSQVLNLQALNRVLFGQTVVVGFETVRCIAIKNQSETDGEYITVTASGSNGFTSIFAGATGKAPVHPKCSIVFPNLIGGWPVSGASKQIEINNVSGTGITFEISVIGVSGSG